MRTWLICLGEEWQYPVGHAGGISLARAVRSPVVSEWQACSYLLEIVPLGWHETPGVVERVF
jgi:hypothetical protein